jgi:hypothetical protein
MIRRAKEVDSEKVIIKAIWAIKSKIYHNRDVSRKLWNEIASEIKSK